MINWHGLSDSIASAIENPVACRSCGATTRIGRGSCPSCLLREALDVDRETSSDAFESVLTEANVPDNRWRLGNYEILEEVGRGGMGVIYRARQRHSRRIVAVKRVLSYHADSRETLERFRREAEAAASLDHPNILPIYEVSESEEGLPYFSMKFATGGSLHEVAHSLRSDPRQCVAIVAKVARATAYAHGQGILHRDLKPGNILLDGHAEPLVSDFGLAKWLDTTSDLTRTLTTFGTPGYIAPEQAEGRAADLTPGADVYSLGAILFDLLTGRPPFIGEHALSVIRQAAENPAPKLRSLAPSLDRDLETICARCLEREPSARYHSAGDLAEDLERWLQSRPIVARPVLPSTRVWRWSRRNPVLVGTAAACLFVGAASIWFLWQVGWMQQISIATKKLLLSPREAAEQSKLQQALVEYPDSDAEVRSHLEFYGNSEQASMSKFFYSALGGSVGSDPKLLRDKLPKFAEVLKRDPTAPLYERACAAYAAKDYAESERLSLKAVDEAQKASPVRTPDVIRALQLAALAACKTDDYVRAREHLGQAEKLVDQQRNPRRWADVHYMISVVQAQAKQSCEPEETLRRILEVRTGIFGPEHRETLRARRLLALCLVGQSNFAEAEREYRELVKLNENILGPEALETIQSHSDLATFLAGDYGGGDPEACLVELRHILRLRERVLGPEDPETLTTRGRISNILVDSGHYAEAIPQKRELLALARKVLGPEDSLTVRTLGNLGLALAQNGELKEAEATLREAIRFSEKTIGATHYKTLLWRGLLVQTLAAQNKGVEAEAEAREVVQLGERTVGAERSGWTRDTLGIVLDKRGRHAEAEAQIRDGLRLTEKAVGPDTDDTLLNRGHLAKTLWYQEKNAEAESVLRELIALNEKLLGGQAYGSGQNLIGRGRLKEEFELTPFTCRTLLANTLRDQHKYAEAETEYKQVIQLEEKVLGPEDRNTLNACYNYAYQLAQQGKRSEARALAERAAKGAAKILPADDPDTREYEKFLEILEKGEPIPIPYMKFHETFWVGK
jgi:serine/threonine protein kinase